MSEENTSEEHAQLERLREDLSQALAHPEPDLETLGRLADRARALIESPDATIAAAAQSLELRALGALMSAQAVILRQLGQQLQRLAHALPAEHPELN